MQCPSKFGTWEAITVNDKTRDELVVFGFVREGWKLSEIADHLYPPRYLIKMMNRYFLNEYVHLISIGNHSSYGEHWRMGVFDIIN